MNRKLDIILQRVTSIQAALMRFKDEKGQHSVHVRVAFGNDNSLHCVITGDIPKIKMTKKTGHLIQKYHDDYFFISGSFEKLQSNSRVITLHITKACWFVRKKRGDLTWFSEKHTHEVGQALLRTAS